MSRRWERDDLCVPTLRFTPYAWSKLLFLRDLGDTEVGGFGISSEDDLFLIENIGLIEQSCTAMSVVFDDEAVADFFDEQIDAGRHPECFGRHWIHTHPGDSAEPSSTDEATFARVFDSTAWSVMFILAQGGETYARLKFGCGPGAELLVPVALAWDAPFPAADHEAWEQEYERCVRPLTSSPLHSAAHLSPDVAAFLAENPDLFDEFGFPFWDGDAPHLQHRESHPTLDDNPNDF